MGIAAALIPTIASLTPFKLPKFPQTSGVSSNIARREDSAWAAAPEKKVVGAKQPADAVQTSNDKGPQMRPFALVATRQRRVRVAGAFFIKNQGIVEPDPISLKKMLEC